MTMSRIAGDARSWMAALALVVGTGFSGEAFAPGEELLREGDIVFQRSRSAQAEAIALATGSDYTHVGIVVFDRDKPFVFEALRTVTVTPYARWVRRGRGGHVVVKRLAPAALSAVSLERMREVGRELRGRPYDLEFRWDDERLYCTELVYKIYERGAGVRIGELRAIGDHNLNSPLVRKVLARRGMPLDRRVLSPQAMFEDSELVTVFLHRP